jgi:hypothetical protein
MLFDVTSGVLCFYYASSNFIVGSSHTIDLEILLNQMCGLNPRRYFDLPFLMKNVNVSFILC